VHSQGNRGISSLVLTRGRPELRIPSRVEIARAGHEAEVRKGGGSIRENWMLESLHCRASGHRLPIYSISHRSVKQREVGHAFCKASSNFDHREGLLESNQELGSN
jgi:hypothetical protein